MGQQEELQAVDQLPLEIDGTVVYLPIVAENKLTVYKIAAEDNSIKTEEEFNVKWDTVRFNPYRGESVSFPIALTFNTEDFASPVERKMVVTSRYGWRRGRPHQGIDIDLVVGESVKSILEGKVRYVGYHGGHGKTVVIRHPNGLETVYAHLSKYSVKENEVVKKGQVIGKGGVTGNSRGSHLHLEVRYHGKSINPEYLFEFSTKEPKVRSDMVFVTRRWVTPRYHRSTRKSNIVLCTSMEDIERIKEEREKVYTVKKGDTLYRIANRYGLHISELCKINSIKRSSVLKVGQQIIVMNP
ncbi:M23 family metallopeptidase [Aquimarina sp. D1M17]|uniref:M23 family metallopeptidase n=1 Tax=Aquimarina acroporae TaxID=2937283 RepID=UPI0020BDE601|nr:M23 family metallopeptidase [Aquimarina acroporae]MCK8520246.1 M23 family metallopeptidase [Aquimarina acroporae]